MRSRSLTPAKELQFHRKQHRLGRSMNCRIRVRRSDYNPQSDASGDKEATTVDGIGNTIQNNTEETTPDDVQTEPEEAADTTLS